MRLDLYQAETARLAALQGALLAQARDMMALDRPLSALEQGGVLHALQLLIENAIGKAKLRLKALGQPVPVSAYDAFQALADRGLIDHQSLMGWNSTVGLRNRIVHDYMNLDMQRVLAWVAADRPQFIIDFLSKPLDPS